MPAVPILFRHFPVLKRFTYASLLYALSRALVYLITSLGLVYLLRYFGSWGLLLLLVPMLAGYGWALFHFEKLEKATEAYPQKKTAVGPPQCATWPGYSCNISLNARRVQTQEHAGCLAATSR